MQKTMKVNVMFQIEVPTQQEGISRSITDMVSPYISDYFADLQKQVHFVKHGIKKSTTESEYNHQNDFDIFEKMEKSDISEYFISQQSEADKHRWEKQKDLECWEFFKITWKEFKTLSWTEQAKLREENGIVWEDNAWIKKGK